MEDRFRFRVWDSAHGEWVVKAGHTITFSEGGAQFIRFGHFEDYAFIPDTFTVEQCSGLKDRNGKLIFEGDILSTDELCLTPDDTPVVVEFRHGTFCCSEFPLIYCHEQSKVADIDAAILGNIHEHPELLEK